MPTREQVRARFERLAAQAGIDAADPLRLFAFQALEDMNQGMADVDDELADIAARLAWLANAATWVNERPLPTFGPFVEAQLAACEATLAKIRSRWREHQAEAANPTSEPDQ